MSRPLRMEYPGARYHVMNRGRRRESILLGGDDYLSFLRVLEEGSVIWMGCTPNASTAHIGSTGPYSADVTRP